MFGDEYPEMADQLRANVSRFSAYKANYVRQAFDDNARQFSGKDLDDANRATINQFRRWTDAELTTAGARARTAKQFTEFNQDDRRELFPCLKWLPSRAVNPRQSHAMFWGGVWRKDDDFWKRHQPGTEWNCMCDLEECDDAPQEPKDYSRKKEPKVPKGFEQEPYGNKGEKSNNPYHTGKVFNDNVGYIAHTSRTRARKIEHKIADNVLRAETYNNIRNNYGNPVSMQLIDGTPINVIFDSKSSSHIGNDVVNGNDFLLNEITKNPRRAMRKSILRAHEKNKKKDEKPSAVEYFYYEYKIGNKVYYFNVEENYVKMEKRHFYRLYSITDKLRDSVILYEK